MAERELRRNAAASYERAHRAWMKCTADYAGVLLAIGSTESPADLASLILTKCVIDENAMRGGAEIVFGHEASRHLRDVRELRRDSLIASIVESRRK